MATTEAEWLAIIGRLGTGADRRSQIENLFRQIASTPGFFSQGYAANVLRRLAEADPRTFWGSEVVRETIDRLATLPYGRSVLLPAAVALREQATRGSGIANLEAFLANPAYRRLALEIARVDPRSVLDSMMFDRGVPLEHRLALMREAARHNPFAGLSVMQYLRGALTRGEGLSEAQIQIYGALYSEYTAENALAFIQRDPASALYYRDTWRGLLSESQIQQAMERLARLDPARLVSYPDVVREYNLMDVMRSVSPGIWNQSIGRHAATILHMREESLAVPWPNAEEIFRQAARVDIPEALRVLNMHGAENHPYRSVILQTLLGNMPAIEAALANTQNSLGTFRGFYAALPESARARFETQLLARIQADPLSIRDLASFTGPHVEALITRAFAQNPYELHRALNTELLSPERKALLDRLTAQHREAITQGQVRQVMERLASDNPTERLLSVEQRTVNGRTVISVVPNEARMLELALPKIMQETGLGEAAARQLATQYIQQHFRPDPLNVPNLQTAGTPSPTNLTTLMITPEDQGGDTSEVIRRMVSHAALAETIRQAGGRVEVLSGPDHPGSGIELWTRDSFLRVGNRIFFPNNATGHYSGRHGEMRRDAEALTGFFRQRGIQTVQTDLPFQGGDMMVDERRRVIFYGMPPGGDRAAYERHAEQLRVLTGYQTVVIERSGYTTQIEGTRHQNLYHLDLIMSVLPNGRMMIFPPGITARSMADIRRVYGNNIVTIQPDEVQALTPNATFVGNTMIVNEIPPRLRTVLERQGIRVVQASDIGPGINFTFGLGSAHCLTNEIPTTPSTTDPPLRHGDSGTIRFGLLQDYHRRLTPVLPTALSAEAPDAAVAVVAAATSTETTDPPNPLPAAQDGPRLT